MGEFKSVLKRLRESRGITQETFAFSIGISRSAVGMYENGSRTPDYELLEKIADYFNVDIDYLIGRTDKTTFIPESHILNINNSMVRLASYASIIDPSLLDRLLAAGGKLPKENLEAFVQAMEMAAAACEKFRK